MNKKKFFLKNSIYLTFGTVIEKASFFIINILIARYLTKENFGEYVTALGFATFFSILSNFGIAPSALRSISVDPEYKNEYFTSSLVYKTLISFIMYMLMTICIFITNYNYQVIALTLILGLVRIANDFVITFYQLYEAKFKFKITTTIMSTFSLSFLLITYLVIIKKGNYIHIAVSRLVVAIFFLSICLVIGLKLYKFIFKKYNFKKFVFETIPYTISILLSSLYSSLGIILIPLLHSTLSTGVFNNANIFFVSVLFLPGTVFKVLIPYLFGLDYRENKEKYQFSFDLYSKILAIIAYFILICFIVYSKNIILLIFKAKYADSIPILQIIAFAVPFTYNPASAIIYTLDKQKINSKIDFIVTIIAFISNYFLIKYFHIKGAAYAIIVCYSLVYILSNYYLSSKRYISYKNTFLVQLKLIIISIITIAGSNYFFNNTTINFIQTIIMIAISSTFYFFLVYTLLIKGEDIRIIKEMIRK